MKDNIKETIKQKEISLQQSFTNFRKMMYICLGIILILMVVSSYYFYSLQKQIDVNYKTTQTNIAQIDVQLTQKIENVDNALGKTIDEYKLQNEQKFTVVDQKITQSQQESQEKIFSLEGQLKDVQNKSETAVTQLKESISNIQIESKDFSAIIDDVVETVVTLKTDKGLGSGVIISQKGYLVTNQHVVDRISKLGIYTADGNVYAGRLIAEDVDKDIAILQIVSEKEFNYLKFEDSDKINVGEKVIAVGNPSGLAFSVSEGIISSTNRVDNNGVPLFQIDAAINPGNSGGPLVTINKKIAGINTLKLTGTEGLGFAIQGDVVKQFAENAIEKYENSLNK